MVKDMAFLFFLAETRYRQSLGKWWRLTLIIGVAMPARNYFFKSGKTGLARKNVGCGGGASAYGTLFHDSMGDAKTRRLHHGKEMGGEGSGDSLVEPCRLAFLRVQSFRTRCVPQQTGKYNDGFGLTKGDVALSTGTTQLTKDDL